MFNLRYTDALLRCRLLRCIGVRSFAASGAATHCVCDKESSTNLELLEFFEVAAERDPSIYTVATTEKVSPSPEKSCFACGIAPPKSNSIQKVRETNGRDSC
jgi:hypothetical protein